MTKQNMPRLTESQLFTIEALNRIDGFVWPKNANHAFMNHEHRFVSFSSGACSVPGADGICQYHGIYAGDISVGTHHPDWSNSLITKEQFNSVDGWVRNTKLKLPLELLDSQVEVLHHNGEIAFDDANAFYWDENVDKWRYRKPSNAEITAAFDNAFNSVAEVSAESWPYVDIIIRMIGLLSSSGVKASQDSQNPAEVWLHDALNLIDNKQPSIPTLTNEQCLKFLCTAFRHNEIKGDIEFDDINLGLRMALSRETTHE